MAPPAKVPLGNNARRNIERSVMQNRSKQPSGLGLRQSSGAFSSVAGRQRNVTTCQWMSPDVTKIKNMNYQPQISNLGSRISNSAPTPFQPHYHLIPTSFSLHRFWADMIQNAPKCTEMNLKKNIFSTCHLPANVGPASANPHLSAPIRSYPHLKRIMNTETNADSPTHRLTHPLLPRSAVHRSKIDALNRTPIKS